jgi:hypothetical protein
MRAATVPQPPTTTINTSPGATSTFLVATDRGDDPTSAAAVELGLQLAREAGARVVLYDRSAESSFTDPFEAAAWAGGQIPTWNQLLSPHSCAALATVTWPSSSPTPGRWGWRLRPGCHLAPGRGPWPAVVPPGA